MGTGRPGKDAVRQVGIGTGDTPAIVNRQCVGSRAREFSAIMASKARHTEAFACRHESPGHRTDLRIRKQEREAFLAADEPRQKPGIGPAWPGCFSP